MNDQILLRLFLIFIFRIAVSAYILNGEEIKDLSSSGQSFDYETKSWKILNSNINVSSCAGKSVLGGYNGLNSGGSFGRNYSLPRAHNLIYLSFTLYRIDDIQTVDAIRLMIDDYTFTLGNLKPNASMTDICGDPAFGDAPAVTFYLKLPHSSPHVSITFKSTFSLSPLSSSFGIRDIYVLQKLFSPESPAMYATFQDLPAINESIYTALTCDNGQYPDDSGTSCFNCGVACRYCYSFGVENCFACQDGYFYKNGKCLSCNLFCKSCMSNSPFECTSCYDDRILFPNGECLLQTCPSNMMLLSGPPHFCICPEGEYYYPNQTCSSLCQRGFNCTRIQDTLVAIPYCNLGFYTYENNSCSFLCDPPFVGFSVGIVNYCDKPCSNNSFYLGYGSACIQNCSQDALLVLSTDYGNVCSLKCTNNDFLYPNGSCLSTCVLPYISQLSMISTLIIAKYCYPPCGQNEFLYQNGSCSESCSFPFFINYTIFPQCNFPCQPDEYFNPLNGTCINQCSSGITTIYTQGQFCNFCSIGEYIYPNNSCNFGCEYPYSHNSSHCYFKCPGNYLYSDGTCDSYCSSPFLTQNYTLGSICEFPCSSSEFLELTHNSCLDHCDTPNIVQIIKTGKICQLVETIPTELQNLGSVTKSVVTGAFTTTGSLMLLGTDPTIASSFLTVLQTFYYLIFFNVEYPDEVAYFIQLFSIAKFDFIPNPFKFTVKFFELQQLPEVSSPRKFEENGYSGLFLISAGSTVGLMLASILLYFACLIFGTFIRSNSNIIRLFKKGKNQFDFQFLLRTYIGIYTDVIICGMLQMRKFSLENPALSISSFLGLFFLLIGLAFPFGILYMTSRKNNTLNSLKKYEPLLEDYDINSPKKIMFGFYNIAKKLLFGLSIVTFYYTSILQVLIPWLTNIFTIVMLILIKPHHRMILNLFDTIQEIGYFILHSCVLAFAYYQTTNSEKEISKTTIGYILIGSCAAILMATFVNVFIEQYIILRITFNKIKAKCSKRKQKMESKSEPKFKMHLKLFETKLYQVKKDNKVKEFYNTKLHSVKTGINIFEDPETEKKRRKI